MFVSYSLHTWKKATLTLEDIEANAAQPVDIGVVDLSKEADLGGSHGVVVWQKELKFKYATCISSVCYTDSPHALSPTLVRRL
jgi:hypothetical protein